MEVVLSAGYVPKAEVYAAALHVLTMDATLDQALPQTKKFWKNTMSGNGGWRELWCLIRTHRAFAEASAGIGFTNLFNL
jgi:hypothetical protein